MLIIVGFIVVIVSVLGGYVLSHGKLGALWQPYELMIIGGAALGAFLVSTPGKIVKETLSGIMGVFKGPQYKSDDYKDTLSLIYELLNKARRDGFMALEDHVEKPQDSTIFGNYPKVVADHHLLDFITDCLRLMIGSNIEPHELEPLLELELEKHHHEALAPSHALSKVSDGLPGFGIVAAVLGIVITMAPRRRSAGCSWTTSWTVSTPAGCAACRCSVPAPNSSPAPAGRASLRLTTLPMCARSATPATA